MGSMSALLGGGIVCWAYGAYVINNHYKEKEAKTNDPEQIFTANDKQDDARVRKIKKRLILGSLVYGVYDMFEGKPPIEWWTKVHYDLLELDEVLTEDDLDRYGTELQDEHKNKYLGVFRRKKESPSAEASDWVVAISGTEPLNWADLQNDLAIVLETLNSKNLITILEVVVRSLGAQHGFCSVNVTGHSLGAAAGLLVCRRLALKGCLVEGHFFNPPFTTLESLAHTCTHAVKHALMRVFPAEGENFFDAGKRLGSKVLHAVPDTDRRSKALPEFKTLAEAKWSPYLYVNKK